MPTIHTIIIVLLAMAASCSGIQETSPDIVTQIESLPLESVVKTGQTGTTAALPETSSKPIPDVVTQTEPLPVESAAETDQTGTTATLAEASSKPIPDVVTQTEPLPVDLSPARPDQDVITAAQTGTPTAEIKHESVIMPEAALAEPNRPLASGDEAIESKTIIDAPPLVTRAVPPAVIEQTRIKGVPAVVSSTAEPTLDLTSLQTQLRNTKAIGLFTKIGLKNQVDDLLKQFRTHYQSTQTSSVTSLRQPYDMLVLKVLALIQDEDPSLARSISGSREAIWGILADPEKFNQAI